MGYSLTVPHRRYAAHLDRLLRLDISEIVGGASRYENRALPAPICDEPVNHLSQQVA
jgi:hypothetical protein